MTPDTADRASPVAATEGSQAVAPTFEQFFAEHRGPVLTLLYSLSGRRDLAEDLAQEAFTEAFRRWSDISTYDDPGAWVRRVAINRSVSVVRRRVSERRALARIAARRVPAPEHEPSDDRFWDAVRALPARQAQAVALHYLEDRSIAAIAEVLDIAEPTVRVHLHRGRLELARTLGLDQRGPDQGGPDQTNPEQTGEDR